MVLDPDSLLNVVVKLKLKEENDGGTLYDQRFVVEEVHLAQISVCDFIKLEVLDVIDLNNHCLALSVEYVCFIQTVVVEAINRKVLFYCVFNEEFDGI